MMRRIGTVLAVTCLAIFGLASTAAAEPPDDEPSVEVDSISNCTDYQPKAFDIPNSPDYTIEVKACVQKSGHYHRAYLRWQELRVPSWPAGDSFDVFSLETRLERFDYIQYPIKYCDITSDANGDEFNSGTCVTKWMYSSLTGGFTADGTVGYNINGDGKGIFYWNLGGSSQID